MYSLLLCYFCIVSYLFYLSFSTNAPFMDICPLFSFSLLLELNGAVSRSLSFFLPSSYLFFSLFFTSIISSATGKINDSDFFSFYILFQQRSYFQWANKYTKLKIYQRTGFPPFFK